MPWYVAQVETHKAVMAERFVTQLGYDVFNPKVRKTHHYAKQRARSSVRSYVPGYMFVNFEKDDGCWPLINDQPGVRTIMYSGPETPAPVRDEALVPLMSMCSNGYVDEVEADRFLFRVGGLAKVIEGPFSGFIGPVKEATYERLKVLLTVFARPTLIQGLPSMFEPV